MSPEPITTERIHGQLKADVMSGRYAPRSEIVIAAIAEEYGVSISPVRASAQRLVGERLLGIHASGGFIIPDITERGVRDLYFWHGQLVRIALNAHALKMRRPGGFQDALHHKDLGADLSHPPAIAGAAAALFYRLVSRSANAEHVRAVAAAGERLHLVRLREAEVLPDAAQELQAVQAVTASGSGSDQINVVRAYHRRRLRRVKSLVAAAGGTVE